MHFSPVYYILVICSIGGVSTQTNNIINIRTFSVSNVRPSKTTHSVVPTLSNRDVQRWANETEMLALEKFQLAHPLAGEMYDRVANAFVGAIFKAYSDHYPLELRVEDIWVAIAQGVNIHLNKNAEKYRHLFVSHEEKKSLKLNADELRISNADRTFGENVLIPAIDWPKAVRQMIDLLKNDLKTDLATLISQPFSLTTPIQQIVLDSCLLHSAKKYHAYEYFFLYSIPQVTLIGLPDDFQSVIDRLNQLKIFFPDLHWWLDPLISHVNKFKASAEGKPDIGWWKNMCHQHLEASGGSTLTGWLIDFVPYVTDGKGHYRKAKKTYSFKDDENVTEGIDSSDFNEAVTQTDFILNDDGIETNMKLIAGFLGIGQNPLTKALRPVLGWFTATTSLKPPKTRAFDEI